MSARINPVLRAPSLEVELWREVGRHLELADTVQRVAKLVRQVAPIDAVLVRRLEHKPTRLSTIAWGAAGTFAEPESVRTEQDPASERALLRFLNERQAVSLSDASSSLVRAVMPPGVSGSALAGPLVVQDEAVGVVVLLSSDPRGLSETQLDIAVSLLEPLSVAFESDARLHELARMREALEADRRALLSRLGRQEIGDTVVGEGAGLKLVMERVEQVARTDAPVLLLGETGSGKELVARAIHTQSRRKEGPVVRVNCGAIPSELVDSELFGHEKGSFTGAVGVRKGWFERADGGTLFLDEIGELPHAAQVRLLRVLQDGSLERVGGHQSITVDVRIVAATHRNLEIMVADGSFREDLWYRISVFPIRLPPLRERDEDIPALAAHFSKRAGMKLSGVPLAISERDIELLRTYSWPGNVRELGAVIERAAILGDGKRLEIAKALGAPQPIIVQERPSGFPAAPGGSSQLLPAPAGAARPTANDGSALGGDATHPGSSAAGGAGVQPLDHAMRSHIERALSATLGRIEGPFGAAKVLGINPHTLRARMRKLGIDWSRYRPRE